ncbi:MAG: hypothetical protein ACRCXZ_08775 [Patescibacteria group bacterium]
MSPVLLQFLELEQKFFDHCNFIEYLPEFGGFRSNYGDATKIFRVKDWLRIYLPVDKHIFGSEGPKYIQQILFPIPTKSLETEEDILEFLLFCHGGNYRGLRRFFGFLSMEFHHVNQLQEKIVYVPKSFHKGFHTVLHPDRFVQNPLSKSERNRYDSNRKKFLKVIGDALMYIWIVNKKSVPNSIKFKYFKDKFLDSFVYEYSSFNCFDGTIHEFVYYHFSNI